MAKKNAEELMEVVEKKNGELRKTKSAPINFG